MPSKSKVKAEKKPEAKASAKAKAPAKTKSAAAKPAVKPVAKTKTKPKSKSGVTLTLLRGMAKDLEVKGAAKMAKDELIHAIQVAEGHAACYARIPDCGQMDCLFRPDCLPEMGVQV